MKRAIYFAAALALALALTLCASAQFEEDVDYMQLMISAAMDGDVEAGQQAQCRRDMKIESAGTQYEQLDFDEMYLLAKVIEAEAGSDWLSDEWKMSVGEVVLNRVASPEFPDTVEDVVFQKGQYYSRSSTFFNELLPSERSVDIAVRLLCGERVIEEESVVFQSNYVLGSGVFLELEDEQLGTTYLCYSYYPEIYEE